MLVVNRFAEPDPTFREDLGRVLGALAAQTGFEEGRAGRNVDDPGLWVLVTRWRDVGSYRRALSSYDVKIAAVPILSRALDEPGAYEDVAGELNEDIPRGTG